MQEHACQERPGTRKDIACHKQEILGKPGSQYELQDEHDDVHNHDRDDGIADLE